jgi:hypothetical protein
MRAEDLDHRELLELDPACKLAGKLYGQLNTHGRRPRG